MQFLKLAGIDTEKILSETGRVETLVTENKNLKEEVSKLNGQNEYMKKQVMEDNLKIEYLQELVETLTKKLELSEEKVQNLEMAYTTDIDGLKVQLKNYNEKLHILEKNDNHYINQIEHLEDESSKNLKIIKRLETRVKTLDTQKTRLNNKMHKLLEKTQEHNLDIIQELNNENKKIRII